MQSVLTAFLACLFAMMVTADRFACPDGCADGVPTQATSQPAPSSCAICHGWSQAPAVEALHPAPRRIAQPRVAVTNPTEPALPIVERPPRVA